MKKDFIYFNNASTTWPKPREVIDLVNESLKAPYQGGGRGGLENAKDYPKLTRERLAEFFDAEKPENFQFTSNVTDSLNALIHGFVKKEGEKIHVVSSELEHNSVLRPLYTLEKEGRIDLSLVGFGEGGHIKLEDVKKAVRDDTRLAVFTHGSNVLGSVQDIAEIGGYLEEEGIYFIVDGAQTAGHEDIDLRKLSVDAFAFTGHKSLYAFQGIGGFYIKDPERIDPVKQGGTGVLSELLHQPEEMPLKYESGTLNYPGIVSLYAGIGFIEKTGLANIRKKTKKMTDYLVDGLSEMDGIMLYNKRPELPVTAFNIEGMSDAEAGSELMEKGIMVRTGLHCAPLVMNRINNGSGCVRASLSFFNTKEECERFLSAVRETV